MEGAMLGYIKIPEWISLDNIDSDRFINFISNAEYEDDNKISLNYLRSYFESNRSIGLDIIDELSLRGFEFHYDGSGKFLPDYRYSDPEEIIISNNSFHKFRNINFQLIGLGDLVRRFDIRSDDFFNYIPVTGFKALTKVSKYGLIKNEFMKNKFLLLSSNNVKLEENRLKLDKVNIENKSNGQKNREANQIYIDGPKNVDFDIDTLKEKYGLILQDIKITEMFQHSNYKFFLRYCYINKISRLYELSNKDIERIPLVRGIGVTRYNNLIEKLYKIKNEIENNNKWDENKIIDNKSLIKIKNAFPERKFQMFREYCEEKQITHLDSINSTLIQEYSNRRGVGDGKLEEIKVILDKLDYKISFNNYEDEGIYNINKIKIGIEEYLNEMKFDRIFYERSFKLIRQYCYKQQIVNLGDLSNNNIMSIAKLKGIGEKKFSEFIVILNNSVNEAISQKNLYSNGVFYLEDDVYEKYKDMKISSLFELLSLENMDQNLLVKDIQGKRISEINDSKLVSNILMLVKKLSSIKNINEIVTLAFKALIKNEDIVITARYCENKTLQETGEILELTRERVRQIEKKALNKIHNIFKINNFKTSLKLTLRNNKIFSLAKLKEHLNNDNLFLLEIIKSGDIKYLKCLNSLNMIYFDDFSNEIIHIQNKLDEISDYGLIEDYLELFETIVSNGFNLDLDSFNINEFLENFGFIIYGKYYSKQKLSYTNILEIIFKYHIKESVRINESLLEVINKLTKSIFNIDYIWTDRNTDSKLRYLEDIILTDRRTFCHIDHLKNNIFLMNQIRDYIDSYLENNEFISSELLFDIFEELCSGNGISNKLHLYSMIKYNFGDYYNTSHGNTLTISVKNNEIRTTNEERLERYITDHNGKVTKKKINEIFHWTRSKIDNTISSSSRLVTFETEIVANIDTIFIEDEIIYFHKIVQDAMKEGWSTAYSIYNHMLFNEKLYRVLNRNNIKQSSTIANVVKKSHEDVLGHTNFLYYKDSVYKNIYDVILSNFQERTNRKEIGGLSIIPWI